MKNQNDIYQTSQTPQSLPSSKKWYRHKGIIAIAVLAVLTAGVCWAYFANQPKQDIAPIVVHHETQSLSSTGHQMQMTTSSAGSTQQPALPASSQTPNGIFFLRNGDIWLANTDGTSQKQITKDGNIVEYYWNQPKNEIVYDRVYNEVTAEIKIKDLATGKEQSVYKVDLPGSNGQISPDYHFSFTVSPDGSKIAYGGDFVNNQGVVVYDISAMTTKTWEGTWYGDTEFSPDSNKLALAKNWNIYVINFSDDSEKMATNFSSDAIHQADSKTYATLETIHGVIGWSPDGNKILYTYGDYGQGAPNNVATDHIYQFDLSTSQAKQLTSSGKGEIDFYLDRSSDGHNLYYSLFSLLPATYYNQSLMKLNLDNQVVNQINPAGWSNNENLGSQHFKISPDNSTLIYDWHEGSGQTWADNIWQMNGDGTNNHRLIEQATNPEWKF